VIFDSNRQGTAYALTTFAPILPGREEAVREHIEALPRGPASPLARLDQLHYSRLQIFDRLVYQGGGQRPDRLRSSYLVFTASLDGGRDALLDAICDRLPAEADGWWGDCAGYPGTRDRAAFKRYVEHIQIPTALLACASPTATVADVRESLALRERVLEFAIAAQALGPAELQQRFRETFGSRR
jgi:hypothetical protein